MRNNTCWIKLDDNLAAIVSEMDSESRVTRVTLDFCCGSVELVIGDDSNDVDGGSGGKADGVSTVIVVSW